MTQEDINEVMANSLKRYQLESLVFDGGNIESAKRLICLLQAENAQLKAQLTWRPVSEKPEKSDRYLIKYRQGKIVRRFIADYDNVDGWNIPLSDVELIEWLPIPPAPEGESEYE